MNFRVPRQARRPRTVLAKPGRVIAAGAAAVLAVTMLGSPAAVAVADPDVFELEGNAVDDPALAGDDWQNVLLGDGGAASVHTGVVSDPAGTTIFTTGFSKDDLDVTGWAHTSGSVPDKDEITNAYAAAYNVAGDLVIYFGSDRFAQNGTANVGFWFFADEVAPLADGTFSGEHQVGDVLVISEFTNGGAVSTIGIYEWVGSGGDTNGTLNELFYSADADCKSPTVDATALACATVNDASVQSPWPYTAKSRNVDPDTIPAGGFFEGGINLTELFAAEGESVPCISSFLAETRSSAAVDATLKDFVSGNFDLCDADVSIAPDDVNDVGESHTFTVSATQTYAGASGPADLDAGDLTVTLADANGDPVTPTTDECADGPESAIDDGTCDVTFSSDTPGTITGHVEGDVYIGDSSIPVSTGGEGENPDATKVYVDARITITPDDVNGIGEWHTFVVDVDQDNGDGGGWEPATVGDVDFTLAPSVAAADFDADASTCDDDAADEADFFDNLDADGRCTITFKSETAGTITGTASAVVRITTSEGDIDVTRSTDGLSDFGSTNSDGADKVYVDGSLTWLKHDDQGALLGGATFEVCQTHGINSGPDPDEFVDIDDVCVDVLDNEGQAGYSGLDTDADAGEFTMEDLYLGRYTVQEKTAPEGYALDPDEVTVDLTTDNVPTSNNKSIAEAFVNPALFKLIVLTCNTTTEKLVQSTVDLDPATAGDVKDTLDGTGLTDAEQNALCALGGASYDELTRGDRNLKVTIPKPTP